MAPEEIFGLLIPATYLIMLAVEARWPAREFPPRRGWRWLGGLFLILMGLFATLTPLMLPPDWLAAHRLVDGSSLGAIGGAAAGFLTLSFVAYLWHRSAHAFPLMWRLFHQIHHSPHRVDISGANLFHPLEMLAFNVMGLLTTTLLLGLDPLAAAITGYIAAFYSMFQHWNIHTPRWLGYVIQRPEAHCLHHRRGVHADNYADFPLWDMLFGSYRNPATFSGDVGFDPPADRRIGGMLGFADVNAPLAGPGTLGRRHPAPSDETA
jgi:sterol desaturase/sphingolipid hydroxylase (fatty acid hydroxylase superfamily)